jgi:ubiquitin carboxyl-terminal hydrolase 14
VSRKLKELEKERSERRKVRKRTRNAPGKKEKSGDVEMGDATTTATAAVVPLAGSSTSDAPATIPVVGTEAAEDKGKAKEEGGELEDESVYREQELKDLEALVDPGLKGDLGCSVSGLYDLVGTSLLLTVSLSTV